MKVMVGVTAGDFLPKYDTITKIKEILIFINLSITVRKEKNTVTTR
jgi:hypothetical protein